MNNFIELYEKINSDLYNINNCVDRITYINEYINFLKGNFKDLCEEYKLCTDNLNEYNPNIIYYQYEDLIGHIDIGLGVSDEVRETIISYYWYSKCIELLKDNAFKK